MRLIRKGNDIGVVWSIFADQGDSVVEYSLQDRNISLFLETGKNKYEIKDFTIVGEHHNSVKFTFWGKDQIACGSYFLTMVENKGEEDMRVLDFKDAFAIVRHSWETGGSDNPHITTEVVELSTNIGDIIDERLIPDTIARRTDFADYLPLDGSSTMTGSLDMGDNKITNVSNPTSDYDATNKKYVDDGIDALDGTITLSNPSSTVTQSATQNAGTIIPVVSSFTLKERDGKLIEKGSGTTDSKVGTTYVDAGGSALKALNDAKSYADTKDAEINAKISTDASSSNKVMDKAYIDGKDAAINAKIPSAASSSNQLADKAWVKAVNDLVNYYKKSETYTQAEVDALIGSIEHFHYEIVTTLPATGESNVLYLLGPKSGTSGDMYEEYVYSNGWVKIGDTSIDLSGYMPKSGGTFTGDVNIYESDLYVKGQISVESGEILMSDDPVSDMAAINKGYVDTELEKKQDKLVSGTNIKTINGEDILGRGNTVVGALQIPNPGDWDDDNSGMPFSQFFGHTVQELLKAGGAVDVEGFYYVVDGCFFADDDWQLYLYELSRINNKIAIFGHSVSAVVDSEVSEPCINTIIALQDGKQDTLVSGTNIKTINSTSLLESGNIALQSDIGIQRILWAGKKYFCVSAGAVIGYSVRIDIDYESAGIGTLILTNKGSALSAYYYGDTLSSQIAAVSLYTDGNGAKWFVLEAISIPAGYTCLVTPFRGAVTAKTESNISAWTKAYDASVVELGAGGGSGATVITNDGSDGDSVAIRLTDNGSYKRSFRIDMTTPTNTGSDDKVAIGTLIVEANNIISGVQAHGYYYGDTLADILAEVAVYQDDIDPDTFYLMLTNGVDLDSVTFAITPIDNGEVDAFITNAGDDHTKFEDATITPVGGSSDVFWATYGSTTYAEIVAAENAGKICALRDGTIVFYRTQEDTNYIYFVALQTGYSYHRRILKSTSQWSSGTEGYELLSNKVSTISGNETNTTKYPNTKAVADALGKMGVISQTQTWSGSGSNPRTYVMSDQVTGLIPQANIDLFESAGATFNATTGYFELNGLTDISYEEMEAIYNASIGAVPIQARSQTFAQYSARATLPLKATSSFPMNASNMFYNSDVEAVNLASASVLYTGAAASNAGSIFYGCTRLKTVTGELRIAANSAVTNPFYHCYTLEDVAISKIAGNISLRDSPNLSETSLLYLINNAGTAAITVTLHATVYAKCQSGGAWYSDVSAALSAHTNITLASA